VRRDMARPDMPSKPKAIEFSSHADLRLASRGISRSQVVSAIRQPAIHSAGNSPYTQRFERELQSGRWLVVIAEELHDRFRVVTAYWKT
jgi:hypothetical protein